MTPGHTVHFYEQPCELLDSLQDFVVRGMERKECVVLVTLPARWKALKRRMGPALDRSAILMIDARRVLARILSRGAPVARRFGELARELLAKTGDRPFRVFGEAVDLLARDGNFEGAVRLEELWNELRRSRPFALF